MINDRLSFWRTGWWVVVCALVVYGCRSERGASSQEYRAEDQIPPRDGLVERASPTDTAVRIVVDTVEFRLSSAPGPRSVEFGWIRAAQFTPDGGIVVLDALNSRLSRYSRRGDPIVSVGRRGEGPGEFQEPEALAQPDSATLLVLDSRARRLTRYILSSTGLTYVSADRLDDWPSAMCALGSTVVGFYYDHTDRMIVHRLSRGDLGPQSLGQALFAETELNITGTMGELVCVPDQRLIVVAPDRTGDIFGYATDGMLRWRTRLRRYRPPLFKLVPNGSMLGFAPGQKVRDFTIAAVRISPRLLLVQIGTNLMGRQFVGEFESIESRILRLSDGVEIGSQDDLPRVTDAMTGRLVTYGTENDVWVEVRRFHVEHDSRPPRR